MKKYRSKFFESRWEELELFSEQYGIPHLLFEIYKIMKKYDISVASVHALFGDDLYSIQGVYNKLNEGTNITLTDFREITRKRVVRAKAVLAMLQSKDLEGALDGPYIGVEGADKLLGLPNKFDEV